jgi:hypothetical protein
MAASLIKVVKGNVIQEFTPAAVVKIYHDTSGSDITIVLVGRERIDITASSPYNAQALLDQLETAMSSGTGVVSIGDSPVTYTTTSTTTIE